jgi:hypothetical protein
MKLLLILIVIAFAWLAKLYINVLARLKRYKEESDICYKRMKLMSDELLEHREALTTINEYVQSSSRCLIDIAAELEKVIGKTAWMDGIDEALGKTINLNQHEQN